MFLRLKQSLLACFLISYLFVLGIGDVVRADLIRLKSGGEVRGFIPRDKGATTDPEVSITTLSGTEVTISQAQIEFVTRRPLKIEEYETRARRTPNTVADQWALAEWCREHNLRKQREFHLERIVQLEPDHKKAHYGLDHTNVDGVWMTREERMTAQGYVKHKGRWVTPQELELTEKTEAEREREQAWHRQIFTWKSWLTGNYAPRKQDALKALQELKDPDAVSALAKHFQDSPDLGLRNLYVSVLKNMPGPKPVLALVWQFLNDVNYELRYAALNAIATDQFQIATPLYLRGLKHEMNPIVCRAGKALERLGDDRIVPDLIEALVTTHNYQIAVPNQNTTMSFRADGSGMVNGTGSTLPPNVAAGLAAGQYNGVIINQPPNLMPAPPKYITVSRVHQNAEVLSALQKITGQNFGFDERSWTLWHAAQKNGAGKLPGLP